MTGVDDQSRASDEAAERPTQARYDQKMAKHGRVAEQRDLRFIPTAFFYTGQTHGEFKTFVKEQTRRKLICFEGEAKISKVRSAMKLWSKRMSMAIAQTASGSVAFKVARIRMRESIMEGQDKLT